MLSVLRTHAFPGITYDFHPGRGGHSLFAAARSPSSLRWRSIQGSVDKSHHMHGAHGDMVRAEADHGAAMPVGQQ